MVLGYETALFLALELKYRQVAVLYVPPFELGFGLKSERRPVLTREAYDTNLFLSTS